MNRYTAINFVLSVTGTAAIWFAAVHCDRLNVEGSMAGPWDYVLYVTSLIIGWFVLAAVRACIRFFKSPSQTVAPTETNSPEIAKLAASFARAGNRKGLELVTDLAEFDAKAVNQ